ncbi:MAG TPA: D-glycero-beta-D-manno-heptose 1-phosphate adenylyltransferase [Cytophagaceae bacterium]|nr:D-glycero-beta-D-manno-heptose 1-phosphate adenylyltransferase [Cytophagaceae bacterium]
MNTSDKILTKEQAATRLSDWKKEGKVVFTNGCFDILHLGHVDYLEKARNLGQKLVVGLNTDASVQRLKGKTRPITDQTSRARVMASLAFVDAVILFDEDTPLELISYLKPDILVKGNDYTIENIVGADVVMNNGGKVETVPLVNGYSTSNVIEKIKKLT